MFNPRPEDNSKDLWGSSSGLSESKLDEIHSLVLYLESLRDPETQRTSRDYSESLLKHEPEKLLRLLLIEVSRLQQREMDLLHDMKLMESLVRLHVSTLQDFE